MPDHWVTDDGQVRLCVAKGTLVPSKTLRCGHPQASHAALCLSITRTLTLAPTPNRDVVFTPHHPLLARTSTQISAPAPAHSSCSATLLQIAQLPPNPRSPSPSPHTHQASAKRGLSSGDDVPRGFPQRGILKRGLVPNAPFPPLTTRGGPARPPSRYSS